MGNIAIEAKSKLSLNPDSRLTLNPDSRLTINKDSKLRLYPLATHIKEVNHIDPLTIESMRLSEVKNIEPLEIAKFNVTNLPMVNVSLQKLPAVDFNVKTLPPISVGTHQNFCIPSNYTLRAQVLGIELIRLHLNGKTSIVPKERARREQARSDNKSFPTPSVAGNPAIPSHYEGDATPSACHQLPNQRQAKYAVEGVQQRQHRQSQPQAQAQVSHVNAGTHQTHLDTSAQQSLDSQLNNNPNVRPHSGTLSFGAPRAAFQLPDQSAVDYMSESRIMSGE